MPATDKEILSKLEYIADVESKRGQALIDAGRDVYSFELSCFKLILPREYKCFIERAQELHDSHSDKAKRGYDLLCRSKASVSYFSKKN